MRNPKDVWLAWYSAILNPLTANILSDAVQHILKGYTRYENVGKMFGIPAWAIGAIHYRESSFDFTTWLANGDPLMRYGKPAITIHVPTGLGPAFSWENGAELSLAHMKWHAGMNWDLVSALQHLEAYNGMGYFNHNMVSPYIWAGTNHYHNGMFTSDGHFDVAARDKRVGCAAIALGMKMHGIDLKEIPKV